MLVKKLTPADLPAFKQLIQIFREVFEISTDSPTDEQLGKLLTDPGFWVFVVQYDAKIVGGLTVYVLPSYHHPKPQAYIYDVGISPDFQRRGLGKMLIKTVGDYCTGQGIENAYVEAEKQDSEAVSFYRQTNPSEEMEAVHFTYKFRQEKNR
jgi:aminoglycoside 3-N-acetyltransferase I